MGESIKRGLIKVMVTFHTEHKDAPPETEGTFKGLPRTECMEYCRSFILNYRKFFLGDMVTFYGKPYRISSYGLSHPKLGILVTEDEVKQLLADAKQQGQRLKKRVGGSVDGRRLFQTLMYGGPLPV